MRVAVALPNLWPDAVHRVALDRTVAALARSGIDVECFAESARLREPNRLPTYHYLRFAERHRAMPFETALYPIGRDYRPYEAALLMSSQLPGLVWVLDPVLHHLVVGGMVLRGRSDAYWAIAEEHLGASTAVALQTLVTSWATPAFYRKLDPVPAWLRRHPRLLAATQAIAASWDATDIAGIVDLPLVEPDPAVTPAADRITVLSMNYNRPEPLLHGLRGLLEQERQRHVSVFAPILTHRYVLDPAAGRIGGLDALQWHLTTEWGDMQRAAERSGTVAFLREDLTVGDRALLHQALAAGKRVVVLRTRHYEAYPEGAVIKVEPGSSLRGSLPGMCGELDRDADLAGAVGSTACKLAAGFPEVTTVSAALAEHLGELSAAPTEWVDIAATSRRNLGRRLREVTLPVNASATSRELIKRRLGAALGERWAALS